MLRDDSLGGIYPSDLVDCELRPWEPKSYERNSLTASIELY